MKSCNVLIAAALVALVAIGNASAREFSVPPGLKTRMVATADGTSIFVRIGGTGPAVVLIHGFGDTGDMWRPLALPWRRLTR